MVTTTPKSVSIISLFLGDRGSGKTLSCTAWAYHFWRQGFNVLSNYELFYVEHLSKLLNYQLDVEDIKKMGLTPPKVWDIDFFMNHMQDEEMTNTTFILDEAYFFMDKRNTASKLNKLFSWFIAQTRKKNVNVLVCTQKENQIDFRLDQAATHFIKCAPIGKTGLFRNIVTNRKLGVRDSFVQIINGADYYDMYDTSALVASPQNAFASKYMDSKNLLGGATNVRTIS